MHIDVTSIPNNKVAARGYVVVENAEGVKEVYYSDLKYCSYAEFNQVTE